MGPGRDLRDSLTNEKLADKFGDADETKLVSAISDAIMWLGCPVEEASKEEYEEKHNLKELEGIINPIMQKTLCGSAGGAPGGFPGASEEGEEVES